MNKIKLCYNGLGSDKMLKEKILKMLNIKEKNIKENYKYIIIIVFGVIFQSLTYFISKFTPITPHLLNSKFDLQIPFIPIFVYFYIFWYLMIFLVPLLFLIRNKKSFSKYITTLLVCSALSLFIFTLYPTTMQRGDFAVKNLSTFIVSLIYKIDTPILNCFPSMHCLLCFLFIFVSLKTKEMSILEKVLTVLFSILVILSTLFVKQHVIIDVISSFFIAAIAYVLVSITKLNEKLFKLLKLEIE